MVEYRLKKVCPICGTTGISNMRLRKYKCYKCKTLFEVPGVREVKTGVGLKLKNSTKLKQQVALNE